MDEQSREQQIDEGTGEAQSTGEVPVVQEDGGERGANQGKGEWQRPETAERRQVDENQVRLTISRLKEIRRKCGTFSARNEEFSQMEERLDEIMVILEEGLLPEAPPTPFSDLARQLVAVERLFESSGFMNVARVVASVEEALVSLDTTPGQAEVVKVPPPPRRFQPPPEAIKRKDRGVETETAGDAPPATPVSVSLQPVIWPYSLLGACVAWVVGRRLLGLGQVAAAVATPVAGTLLGLAAAWVHRQAAPLLGMGRDQRALGLMLLGLVVVPVCIAGFGSLGLILLGLSGPEEPPPVVAVVAPSPTATPSPTPDFGPRVPLDLDETVLERVPEEVALADAARLDGDLQLSKKHLAIAAAIDPHHRLVIEMAASLVDTMLQTADEATSEGEWEVAADLVEQARVIARRFYFDTKNIDETARRHAAMDHFEDVAPSDIRAIRTAVGKRVRITLRTYETISGKVKSFDGTILALEVRSGVGGGQVRFIKEIPLRSVSEVRVYP